MTLKKLQVITTSADQDLEKEVFGKKVILESFAVYWQPVRSSKDILFAELIQNKQFDDKNQIDDRFNESIYTRENSSDRMKFLLGPISSDAQMQYCPRPAKIEYSKPEVRLSSYIFVTITYTVHDIVLRLHEFTILQFQEVSLYKP